MNKLLLSVFMAGLSFMALPHTENEKLEVGRYMARFVKASTSYDHIDEALANYREWSRPEVFFGINIDGWTVDEKKEAFDAYIRYIATTRRRKRLTLIYGTLRQRIARTRKARTMWRPSVQSRNAAGCLARMSWRACANLC